MKKALEREETCPEGKQRALMFIPCAHRCPVKAITEKGHEKYACSAFIYDKMYASSPNSFRR
jgi:hypothetical protein